MAAPIPVKRAAAKETKMADEIENGSPAIEAPATEVAAAPIETPNQDNPTDSRTGKSSEITAETSREELTRRVEESLANFREIDNPVAEEPEPEPKAESEGAEPKEETEEPAEGEQEPAEASEQQPKTEAKPSGPTLPDAYRRSLKAYDWTDEEIDKSFKANPLEFTVTAQRLHANRNKETSQWADQGRAMRANQPQQQAQTNSEAIDPKTGLFKPLDINAMAERYGNEELVREIATPVNEVLARINAVLPDLLSGVSTVQRQRTQQLVSQIDSFFGRKDLAPFAAHYGKDTASLTEEQMVTRNKVLEMADALVSGAKHQNRNLSVDDALLMAHDHVSSGLKTETVRKQIASTVTKRSASLTMKPASGSRSPNLGAPKSKTELENRTKERLRAVFAD